MSVAMALATGGASAGAGGKLVADIVKKEMAQKAAAEAAKKQLARKGADALKKKMIREMAEKGGKKGVVAAAKKKETNVLGKKRTSLEKPKKITAREARAMSDTELELAMERHPKKAGVIRIARLHPDVQKMYQEAETACKNIGRPELAKKFWSVKYDVGGVQTEASIQRPKLRIVDDVCFNEYLRRGGIENPVEVAALTESHTATTATGKVYVESVIDLRESRMTIAARLIEDLDHETNHPYIKLTSESQQDRVEGFIEYRMYRNAQLDETIPLETRKEMRITEPYRPHAKQEYLMEKIIGQDHNTVGYTVVGEAHLRETLDRMTGTTGEYDRIYGVSDPAERLEAMKEVFVNIETNPEITRLVFKNLDNIDNGVIDMEIEKTIEKLKKNG